MKLGKIIHIVLAVMVASQGLHAAEVQKVGTTSLQILKIAASPRAIGMGETYSAVADDIQSVFWNPAGLIHLKGNSAYFAQVNMPAGIQFNSAAVARRFGVGVWSLHFLALTTDDMPVRTIYKPEGTGENFMAYDIIGGVSYAQSLTDRFCFGFNLRGATSSLDDVTYTGVLADLGTQYQTALRTLRLGLAVQNFGPDVAYNGSYKDYLDQGRRARENPQDNDYSGSPPPTIYRIGLSANPFTLFGIKQPYQWEGIMAVEMSHPNDNRERMNLGMEMTYLERFILRAGYKIRYKNLLGYDEERWTLGFGLHIAMQGSAALNFDYAFMDFGRIYKAAEMFKDQPHRFSVGINF